MSLTIYADVQFSRRKRVHVIMDNHDTMVWSGPTIGPALEYCLDAGHYDVKLDDGRHTWTIKLSQVREPSNVHERST